MGAEDVPTPLTPKCHPGHCPGRGLIAVPPHPSHQSKEPDPRSNNEWLRSDVILKEKRKISTCIFPLTAPEMSGLPAAHSHQHLPLSQEPEAHCSHSHDCQRWEFLTNHQIQQKGKSRGAFKEGFWVPSQHCCKESPEMGYTSLQHGLTPCVPKL